MIKSQIELSILDVFLRFLQPLRQRIALLRSAKLMFVLIKLIVSEYDSFRFSLSLSASFWMVFVEPGAAPSVHAKISGTQLLCSTFRILCWCYNVLTLMIILGVRYSFRARFSMGVENFYIEKGSAESASPDSICLDVGSISTSWLTSSRSVAKVSRISLCLRWVYPPLGQCREWVSVNGYPHGHVCGMFGSSHPYLRCYPSLNSDLLREKLCFFKGSTPSQFTVQCFFLWRDIYSQFFFLMSSFP